MLLVILNVCEVKQEVSAFCMDAKGTEDKNYSYQYLERLKYGLLFCVRAQLHPGEILSQSPLFSESVLKHLFLSFQIPSYHAHTCAFPLPLPPQYF